MLPSDEQEKLLLTKERIPKKADAKAENKKELGSKHLDNLMKLHQFHVSEKENEGGKLVAFGSKCSKSNSKCDSDRNNAKQKGSSRLLLQRSSTAISSYQRRHNSGNYQLI